MRPNKRGRGHKKNPSGENAIRVSRERRAQMRWAEAQADKRRAEWARAYFAEPDFVTPYIPYTEQERADLYRPMQPGRAVPIDIAKAEAPPPITPFTLVRPIERRGPPLSNHVFPTQAHNVFSWPISPFRVKFGGAAYRETLGPINYHETMLAHGRMIARATNQEERDIRLLQLCEAARFAHVCYESDRLKEAYGLSDRQAENLARWRCDSTEPSRLGRCQEYFAEGMIVETALKAVEFNDEDFLGTAQEYVFELGTTLRYRSAMAKFLSPYPTKGDRLEDLLSSQSPGLFVRSSVLDKAGIRHRSKHVKVKPIILGGEPVCQLSAIDELLHAVEPDFNRRWNIRFGPEDFEMLLQCLDARTAGELDQLIRKGATVAQMGKCNYKHLRRSIVSGRIGGLILRLQHR